MGVVDYLVVLSGPDPVATAVAERLPTGETLGRTTAGEPVRRLGLRAAVVRREVLHIRDAALDRELPADVVGASVPVVFASIHRSAEGVASFTVHPLGNPGPHADYGGLPRRLTPTAPGLMTATLRALAEAEGAAGIPTTFEATHHGPLLERPAFFAEIGFGAEPAPPPAAVQELARVLADVPPPEAGHTALGVGGGHYVPHLTDLALERRWAFGHLISRHALADLDRGTAQAAWEGTPGAEGILFSRAADATHTALSGLGPRLREGLAPRRRED